MGALLFLLYINDLPLCTRFRKIVLFADDLFLSSTIMEPQSDLDVMYKYLQLWRMDFNVTKFNIIPFTKSKILFYLIII